MNRLFRVLLLVLMVSCSRAPNNESVFKQIEIVKAETMDIHDELMIQMGDLKSLKMDLTELFEVSNDSAENIGLSIKNISNADNAMWDWMHNFNIAYQDKNDSITFIYFESKLKELKEVKSLFDSAIGQSRELME